MTQATELFSGTKSTRGTVLRLLDPADWLKHRHQWAEGHTGL